MNFATDRVSKAQRRARRFLFVGEKPSPTAHKNGWTWRDGRLAAKPLFEALRGCGIDPDKCGFTNAFADHIGKLTLLEINGRMSCLRAAADAGTKIVALGNKVASLLNEHGIPHIKLRHPAARGAGRAKSIYAAHVKSTLEAA